MKVHLDDESPVPLEMMFRYLSQVPNTYVFGMLDICRKEDPEAATQANTYGATDLKEDANSSSNGQGIERITVRENLYYEE